MTARHTLRDDPRPPPSAPRLLPLAVPLFAEMALAIGMGLVGTVLAARLGDAQGAAFALCNQVLAMLFVFFRIIGAGVGVVVPWGTWVMAWLLNETKGPPFAFSSQRVGGV